MPTKIKDQITALEGRVEFLEKVLQRSAFKVGIDLTPFAVPQPKPSYPFAVGRTPEAWTFLGKNYTVPVVWDCPCGKEHMRDLDIPRTAKSKLTMVLKEDPELGPCEIKSEVEIIHQAEFSIDERLKKCQSGVV